MTWNIKLMRRHIATFEPGRLVNWVQCYNGSIGRGYWDTMKELYPLCKPHRVARVAWLIPFMVALTVACRPTSAAAPPLPTPEITCIRVIYEVIIASDADALAATEAAFLGEVTAISPTHFNQDSGEYYDGALGVHTVTFRVLEPIVDEIGLGPEVTLTDLSGSPVDGGHVDIQGGNVRCFDMMTSHSLAVGQQVVVLARRNEIVWRGGTREIMAFAVWAADSYFVSDEQGQYARSNSEWPGMTYEALSAHIRDWQEAPATEIIQSSGISLRMTREEMFENAQVIFLGRVERLSPSYLQEDDAEDSVVGGVVVHDIIFEVLNPIMHAVEPHSEIIVTTLGNNPEEEGGFLVQTDLGEVRVVSEAEHELQAGDTAIVFAQIPGGSWSAGSPQVVSFVGVPTDSYYLRGEDGLFHGRPGEKPLTVAQLMEQVAVYHEVIENPIGYTISD